jgi:short-chain 2-methylacyl-CoA dehydrogenase
VDFDLSGEHELIRRTVREFAQGEIAPVAEELDRTKSFPYDIVAKLGALGLMGIPFPQEYGGGGGDTLAYALAVEELTRVDSSVAITLCAHTSLGTQPIYVFGSEEQKREWMPQLCSGRRLGAFGLTEPEAGSDAGNTRTRARLQDGEWVIDGAKQFITNAGTNISGVVCITAVTADGAADAHGETAGERAADAHGEAAGERAADAHREIAGESAADARGETAGEAGGPAGGGGRATREISNLIVPNGTPGYEQGEPYRKMGWNASDTRPLSFDGCRVPEANLLGPRGAGFKQFLHILDIGRIGVAAMGVGLAQGALDEALRYARERKAFGRPISKFQAIQAKLADMSSEIAAARLLVYKAAREKDAGRNFTLTAAQAKLKTGRLAVRCSEEAVQIHGGYGFIEEYPVCRFYRDAKILTIGEGTDEVQQMVIARALGA